MNSATTAPMTTSMSATEKTPSWKILIAAALVGIAGDALMRGGMLRLGFSIWVTLLAICAVVIGGSKLGAVHDTARVSRERALLLGGTVLASLGLVWRDSEMLFAIDILSTLCMGALTIWHGSGGRLQQFTVIDSVRAAVLAVINSIGGTFGVLQQRSTERGSPAGSTQRTRALVIGIVLAAPPLLIVTALLVASDVVFKSLIDRIVTFLEVDAFQHVLVAFLCAWVAAGWLRAALGRALRVPIPEVRSPALPFMSVGVGLYALVTVLSVFLITQLRVLFGGEQFLMSTQGLTVATYAREGFFQLVVAAGVVLGTLVVAQWLLDVNDVRGRRHYRAAGALLLTLVATLLASATTRMWLYVREFGLTIDRAAASAIMVWVIIALIVFASTMLRGRADRFAPSTLVATVAWVMLLNFVNLEAIVVRVNVQRAQSGQSFDAAYHAKLSADALPALLAAAPALTAADCHALSDALIATWSKRLADPADGGQDWRALDWPLWRARGWFDNKTVTCQ